MEHQNLKNLALQRFGKGVSEVFEKLLILSKRYPKHEFENKYLNHICLSLEEYVHKSIPQTLANELSDVIIRMVSSALELQWKSEFENTWTFNWDRVIHNAYYGAESHDRYSDFVNKSTDLAVEVSCAATHTCLTTFKYDKSSDLHFQQKYLRQMLRKTVDFKQLILDEMPMADGSVDLPVLEYWSSEQTRIDVVRELTEESDRLKILNIQMAEIGLPAFHGNDSLDFILRIQNLTHLNMAGICFPRIYAREKLFEGLSSFRKLNNSSLSSVRTELKTLGLLLLHEDSLFIARYLPNITSLEVTLFHEVNLTPFKNLNHLKSLGITATSTTLDFTLAKDLIREIGSRLLVLKLSLTTVDFNFIATYCTQLKSFIYSFITRRENFVGPAVASGTISSYFESNISTVENLELRLCGSYIWKCFPHILNCFPNVKKLKLCSLQKPEEKNVSLQESLIVPLSLGKFEELIFNNKKVEICGKRAFVTSNNGYVLDVKLEDLEEIMEAIRVCKEIPDMGRKYTVIPRPKFLFPVAMMQR